MQTQQLDVRAILAPPQPYSALIFDLDGTLADTMSLHYRAWAETLANYGAEIPEERFYKLAGMPSVEIIRLLNTEYGLELDETTTHIEKESLFAQMAHTIVEIRAVADIARKHHGKVPMAVASGGTREVVERTLTNVKLRHLFDVVIAVEDVKHGKPAPDMFLLAAERLGVPTQYCVVYEDAELGLEAARRANMRAIDVRALWQA